MELADKILTLQQEKGTKYKTFGELLEGEVPDEKHRVRMGTVLVVLDQLSRTAMNAHDVANVIRWRNEKGEPGEVEIQFNKSGREKRRAQIFEKNRMAELTDALKFMRWF